VDSGGFEDEVLAFAVPVGILEAGPTFLAAFG